MPRVHVEENRYDSFTIALRRFKKKVEMAGILTAFRQHEFYEKPSAIKKRKRHQAIKRHQKALLKAQRPQPNGSKPRAFTR